MSNDNIRWNVDLIDLLKDKIDWSALYKLKGFKIGLDFIRIYSDKIDFKNLAFCNLDFDEKESEILLNEYYWDSKLFYKLQNDHGGLLKSSFENHFANVDWEIISQHCTVGLDFIEKYKDKLNWECLSKNQSLPVSLEFVTNYENHLDSSNLSQNPRSVDLIKKYPDLKCWDWNRVLLNRGFDLNTDLEFLYRAYKVHSGHYDSKLNPWVSPGSRDKETQERWLKYSFINRCLLRGPDNIQVLLNEKSIPYYDWKSISKSLIRLPWDLIFLHHEEIDLKNSSFLKAHKDVIPEDFIDTHITRFDLDSRGFYYLNLSDDLVNNHSERINWCYLSLNESVTWTDDFINKNSAKLDFFKLSINPKVYRDLGIDVNYFQ